MSKRPRIAAPVGRSVPEWIGKTPDAKIPDDVQLRVWRRQKGVDPITGRKIRPGEAKRLDHIKPLWEGGEHRESNLQWLLDTTHKDKTAEEAGRRAKADAVAKRDIGIAKLRRKIPSNPDGLKAGPKPQKTGGKSDLSHLGLSEIARRYASAR